MGQNSSILVCEEHDLKTCEFFCQSCDQPICGKCILSGHKFHEHVDVSAGCEIRKKLLENYREGLERKKDDLQAEVLNLNNLKKEKYKRYLETGKSIVKNEELAIEKVKSHTKMLEKDLNDQWEEISALFEKIEKSLNLEIRKLNSDVDKTCDIMDIDNNEHFLQETTNFRTRILTHKQFSLPLQIHEITTQDFISGSLNEHGEMGLVFGHLHPNECIVCKRMSDQFTQTGINLIDSSTQHEIKCKDISTQYEKSQSEKSTQHVMNCKDISTQYENSHSEKSTQYESRLQAVEIASQVNKPKRQEIHEEGHMKTTQSEKPSLVNKFRKLEIHNDLNHVHTGENLAQSEDSVPTSNVKSVPDNPVPTPNVKSLPDITVPIPNVKSLPCKQVSTPNVKSVPDNTVPIPNVKSGPKNPVPFCNVGSDMTCLGSYRVNFSVDDIELPAGSYIWIRSKENLLKIIMLNGRITVLGSHVFQAVSMTTCKTGVLVCVRGESRLQHFNVHNECRTNCLVKTELMSQLCIKTFKDEIYLLAENQHKLSLHKKQTIIKVDWKGAFLSVYQNDRSGRPLFKSAKRFIVFDEKTLLVIDDGRVVIIVDNKDVLDVMNYTGHPSVNASKEFKPSAIEKTPSQYVLVSDHGSKTLHVINKLFQLVTFVKVDFPIQIIRCSLRHLYLGSNTVKKKDFHDDKDQSSKNRQPESSGEIENSSDWEDMSKVKVKTSDLRNMSKVKVQTGACKDTSEVQKEDNVEGCIYDVEILGLDIFKY